MDKPQILIPFDFDQYVVDIHHVYGPFPKGANPDEFSIGGKEKWKRWNKINVYIQGQSALSRCIVMSSRVY